MMQPPEYLECKHCQEVDRYRNGYRRCDYHLVLLFLSVAIRDLEYHNESEYTRFIREAINAHRELF